MLPYMDKGFCRCDEVKTRGGVGVMAGSIHMGPKCDHKHCNSKREEEEDYRRSSMRCDNGSQGRSERGGGHKPRRQAAPPGAGRGREAASLLKPPEGMQLS